MKLVFHFSFLILLFLFEPSKQSHLSAQSLDDTIRIEQLEVRSSILEAKVREVGGAFSLLDSKTIQSDVNQEITAVLQAVPGLTIQKGALNTSRISIRGIGARTPYSTNRIKIYYDDIPINDAQGEASISELESMNIGRIEVLRGPSSALYGAGLGGVIKLYPDISVSDTTQVLLYYLSGSNAHQKTLVRPHVKVGNFHLALTYGNEEGLGYRDNSNFEKTSFSIISGYQFSNTSLKLHFQRTEVYGQIPSSLNIEDYQKRPGSAARNWKAVQGYENFNTNRVGLSLQRYFNPKLYSKTILFGSLSDSYEVRPFNNQAINSESYGLRQVFSLRAKEHNIRLGLESYNEKFYWQLFETLTATSGPMLQSGQTSSRYFNVFATADWSINQDLKINLGSNLQISDRVAKPVFSPRLGLGYSMNNWLFLHGSLGHGFSLPTFEESILPDGGYNETLLPEQGWNIDFGIRSLRIANRIAFDVSFYQAFLHNLILTKRIAEDQFLATNAGRTNHQGIEVLLDMPLIKPQQDRLAGLDLNVSLNVGQFMFIDFVDEGRDFSGNHLPGIPKADLYASLQLYDWNHLAINFDFNYSGEQYLNDANEIIHPAHGTFDLSTRYEFRLGNRKLRFFGGIRNLSDVHYASMVLVNAPSFGSALPRYYYPGQGRNYFIGLRAIL